MHKYQVTIWWSERDGCFLAMAPELPRCIMDGETPEAALRECHAAIDTWLEMAREDGDAIPQPRGTLIALRDEFDWQHLPPRKAKPKQAAKSEPMSKAPRSAQRASRGKTAAKKNRKAVAA